MLRFKPSTLSYIREARRTPGFSLVDWLHGYIYARWPYFYIGTAVGANPAARRLRSLVDCLQTLGRSRRKRAGSNRGRHMGLSETPPRRDTPGTDFANGYHGKVVSLNAARQLVTIDKEISLYNLDQVIPYTRARDIVLKNPDNIVALECPCRVASPNPCLPLDVCLVVGEPFASFVVEHHPRRSRWIAPDEAAEILKAEDARGHVHHAFFKDAMLDRFYAICNCCPCCCGAMRAHRHGVPMLASSGYVAQVSADRCSGCGQCHRVCPFDAVSMVKKAAVVKASACMGCGLCISHCKRKALSLVRDPGRGKPLEILELLG
jgi:NAD-dependent dihydropyrimidine dehydrogenase PreA subunit